MSKHGYGVNPLFPFWCGDTPRRVTHLQATAEAKEAKAEAKRLSAAEKLRSLMHWSDKLKEMLPKEAGNTQKTLVEGNGFFVM